LVSLHEARYYLGEILSEKENDCLIRNALFQAKNRIGLAILSIEEVEYWTGGVYSQES
jgi:hypothetical protein